MTVALNQITMVQLSKTPIQLLRNQKSLM